MRATVRHYLKANARALPKFLLSDTTGLHFGGSHAEDQPASVKRSMLGLLLHSFGIMRTCLAHKAHSSMAVAEG